MNGIQPCPHCGKSAGTTTINDEETFICVNCTEDTTQGDVAYKPHQTYIEKNNIYTCPNDHSFSFHTEEAQLLKRNGICQVCVKEAREALGMKDAAVEVSLPSEMDEATIELLSRKITETLMPVMLGKIINPEYKGDIELQKHNDDLHEELKKALTTQNTALEWLWAFIDAASGQPRHGNIFDRAKEFLPVAQIQHDIAMSDSTTRKQVEEIKP